MPSSDSGTVHIIGAGLAGLAAAVRLTAQGRRVAVHEATGQPGGRCRSYYDHVTGMVIDNGSHLLLSGNHAARDYLKAIGAEHLLEGPPSAEFDFIDLPTLKRWTVRFNDGQIPWWIFDKTRRVPATKARDYLGLLRLMFMSGDKPLSELVRCEGPLYERLLEPLFLAALRIEPPAGAPRMIGVVNGTTEWIFALPGRVAVTVSDAGELVDAPRTDVAQTIWNEVAKVLGLPDTLPPWQIVRERRATFAATPEENAKRPQPSTRWRNLVLAGDWTDTGLPATIEGAVRSGHRAAELVAEQGRSRQAA